jgi:4-alpha-glucanotransferase
MGWFLQETDKAMKERFFKYIGREISPEQVPGELIRLAMMSIADTVIFPVQDILVLDADSRMNTPGTRHGNWEWRMKEGMLNPPVSDKLRQMTEIYGRV